MTRTRSLFCVPPGHPLTEAERQAAEMRDFALAREAEAYAVRVAAAARRMASHDPTTRRGAQADFAALLTEGAKL